MTARIEHANITVSDPSATAAWMHTLFGWHIRWEGDVQNGAGHTKHVGTDTQYIAIYGPKSAPDAAADSRTSRGGLNHIGVTVPDLDATERAVVKQGFTPMNHDDYEPGRRFYFHDADNIEYEVVCYDSR